jgi:hypothetical protein
MPQPYSEALRLHLERARDHEGGSETALCADYWLLAGRGPRQGMVVEELKEADKPPPADFTKTAPKNVWGFCTFWLKKRYFSLQVLNKIYPQNVFLRIH